MGVGGHALEEIMDKVKNRHYQVLYFIAIGLTKQYDIPELTGLCGIIRDMKARRLGGLPGCPRMFYLVGALDRNSTTQMK